MVKETEQIKRMKELSLNSVYSCCGEIYRLFSYENLPKLIKKIKMGEVKLNSTLLYGRDIITTEERFLENLNKYIGYVRDHYFVNHIEQFCLIETSLTNKYTKCLFELKDYHVDENYEYYHDMFRKMFMFNYDYSSSMVIPLIILTIISLASLIYMIVITIKTNKIIKETRKEVE